MESPGSSSDESGLLELNNSFLIPSPVKQKPLDLGEPIKPEELAKSREVFAKLLEKLDEYEKNSNRIWDIEYPARKGAFHMFHPPQKEFLSYDDKELVALRDYLHPSMVFPAGSPYKSLNFDVLNHLILMEKYILSSTKEESEASSWYCFILSCLSDSAALCETASSLILDHSKFDQSSFIEILHFWGFKESTFIISPGSENIRPFLSTLADSADHFPTPPSASFLLLLLEMCFDPKFREEGSLLTKAIGAVIRRLQTTGAEWTEKLVEFLARSYNASPSHISYLIISFILTAEEESSTAGIFLGKRFLSTWLDVPEPENLNVRTLSEMLEGGKKNLSLMKAIPLYHTLNLVLALLTHLEVKNQTEYKEHLPQVAEALKGVPSDEESRDRFLSVVVEDLVACISNKNL